MADLLVRLYDLPAAAPVVAKLAGQGFVVGGAGAIERGGVGGFARANGSEGWASECEAAFARLPVACFVAVDGATEALVGFACHEATCRDFFGPEVVHPGWRGRGIGLALLLVTLEAMRAQGYAYAVIGWASSVDFYRKAVGAIVIEGSDPGIYPRPILNAGDDN
jgi:GNAT superfamily N-acetyltransferase